MSEKTIRISPINEYRKGLIYGVYFKAPATLETDTDKDKNDHEDLICK